MGWFRGPDIAKLAKGGAREQLRSICLEGRNQEIRCQAATALAGLGACALPDLIGALLARDQHPAVREHIRTLLKASPDAAMNALVGVLRGRDSRAALGAMTELGELGNRAALGQLRAILTNVLSSYGAYAEQIDPSAPSADTQDTAEHFTRLCAAIDRLGDGVGLIVLLRVMRVHSGNPAFIRTVGSCLTEITGFRPDDSTSAVQWLAWYEAARGVLPDEIASDDIFSGRVAKILRAAGLKAVVHLDGRIELRISHEGGRVESTFVARRRDFGGLDIVRIWKPIREVKLPLSRSEALRVLRINALRVIGALEVQHAEGRSILILEHRFPYAAFDDDAFLGALATVIRGEVEISG